ncbi:uncharacterized protein LOC143767209 [Ranitomeya variabilis]|uniref:uncharacterized protein LOC143767209 n=1 Tax=Ranitomeya variabilis TaxID=490064 RepID=UPI004055D487
MPAQECVDDERTHHPHEASRRTASQEDGRRLTKKCDTHRTAPPRRASCGDFLQKSGEDGGLQRRLWMRKLIMGSGQDEEKKNGSRDDVIYKVCDIPAIWDAADVSYKDKYFRDHCWSKICRDLYPEWDSLSIANQLEIEKHVRQRWRSVRDRFNKFINSCDRSGSSPSRKTFPFYDELQFLLTSRTLRRTEGNLSTPPPVDDTSEDGAGSSSGAGGTISLSVTTASAGATCPAAAAGTSTAAAVGSSGTAEAVVTEKRAVYPVAGESSKKKKKNMNEDKTEKIASDTLTLLKQSSTEDQCDFFALTIARKARSLPPDRQSLFMSLCQTSLTALEDPAPIQSYEDVLMGVFGLFRPPLKPREPQSIASSYTQPAQNFLGGGNTSFHHRPN